MADVTTDELLRLARKAWPGLADVMWDMATVTRLALFVDSKHAKTEQAMHAALLVLAGELDVAALLAERDRLRALCTEAIEEIRLVSPMTAREFAAQLASPQENP